MQQKLKLSFGTGGRAGSGSDRVGSGLQRGPHPIRPQWPGLPRTGREWPDAEEVASGRCPGQPMVVLSVPVGPVSVRKPGGRAPGPGPTHGHVIWLSQPRTPRQGLEQGRPLPAPLRRAQALRGGLTGNCLSGGDPAPTTSPRILYPTSFLLLPSAVFKVHGDWGLKAMPPRGDPGTVQATGPQAGLSCSRGLFKMRSASLKWDHEICYPHLSDIVRITSGGIMHMKGPGTRQGSISTGPKF